LWYGTHQPGSLLTPFLIVAADRIDTCDFTVIRKIIVDELLIVDKHIKLVRTQSLVPFNTIIRIYSLGNRRFSSSVPAIKEVDEGWSDMFVLPLECALFPG
jgi:hypothetical protein